MAGTSRLADRLIIVSQGAPTAARVGILVDSRCEIPHFFDVNLIQTFIERAAQHPIRVVYPEGRDARILAAAAEVRRLGVAYPIILGEPSELEEIAVRERLSLAGLELFSPTAPEMVERYATAYATARGVDLGVARKLVRKPLAFGGMMVRMGDADAMVAGIANATAMVIQAASLTIGFDPGLSTPSSFFIMVVPLFLGEKDRVFVFADCAVNISPTPRQLAETGVAAGRNARDLLGLEPRIAFLSFSTKGSAQHPDVDKVVEAVKIAREIEPTMAIDGELQVDAAVNHHVAAKKLKELGPVAGRANVLIFPDLDAGNMGYKLVQHFGGATALGPFLQGFAKPVTDLSRGASVSDVVGATAILCVKAQAR
ncbi:MAG: phosphate acyltransferase [Kiritimatiellia bacterium]